MLLVATPMVALFLQPAAQHSNASTLADAVEFAYPLGDAIIVGATLGVLALMGWRPGRTWIALGMGFAALGIADAIYSADALGHSYKTGTTVDALLLACRCRKSIAAVFPAVRAGGSVGTVGRRCLTKILDASHDQPHGPVRRARTTRTRDSHQPTRPDRAPSIPRNINDAPTMDSRHLHVVAQPTGAATTVSELRAFSGHQLSAPQLPREVRVRTEIPRSTGGKPLRRMLA